MNCPLDDLKKPELLLDYCSGRTSVEATMLLEDHIASCAGCREFVSAQNHAWAAMDAWEAPAVSSTFDEKLFARIASEENAPGWKRMWIRWMDQLRSPVRWSTAVPIAAVCLAIVIGVFLYRPAAPPVFEQTTAGQTVKEAEVEQAETALDDIDMLKQLNASSARKESM